MLGFLFSGLVWPWLRRRLGALAPVSVGAGCSLIRCRLRLVRALDGRSLNPVALAVVLARGPAACSLDPVALAAAPARSCPGPDPPGALNALRGRKKRPEAEPVPGEGVPGCGAGRCRWPGVGRIIAVSDK